MSSSREKNFAEKEAFWTVFKEMICYPQNDEKWTGGVIYPFVKWKVFTGARVPLNDLYISVVKTPG